MEILKKMSKAWKLTAAALILLSSSAYAAQQTSLVTNIKNNTNGSQTLLNHVPREVALGLATKISLAGSSQMLNLRILLPSKDQAGLDSFTKELYDPKSPNYHKFLTPQQFALQFGPSTVDSSLVIEQLKSQGLTVAGQSKNGFILTVIGPVSKVESAFKVNINNYSRADGTKFFAPDANPTIPVQVAGKIIAISGLDNAVIFRSFSHRHTVQNQTLPIQKGSGAVSAVQKVGKFPSYSGPDGFLGPADVITAYNLSSITSTGSGQKLAVFELDGYAPSDINAYQSYFHLPGVPLTNYLIDGATGVPDYNAGASEVTLDIEIAMGIAQGLTGILVYEAPNTDIGWEDEWNQIASDDTAKVISCSWGEPEQASSTTGFDNTIFQEMTAQGQSVFVASGDSGAYGYCDPNEILGGTCPPADMILEVQDPASAPYSTSVGISVLTTNGNGTYNHEVASGESGGGISVIWSIPTYQQGLTLAPGSLVSTTMRNVPDLSLTADNSTPYDFYIDGSWGGWWGSSIASPIWAAFTSRVNQGRVAVGLSTIGFINPAIYQIAQQSSNYANDFHDITSGNNSFYPAKVGYDDATGLGSFNGANLYNDLIAPPAPTGLAPTTPVVQEVLLNWTAATGAASYNVKRSQVNGGPYTTISTSGAVTSPTYTDSSVAAGITYYYVVSGVNGAGVEGQNSTQVSADPLGPPVIITQPLNTTVTQPAPAMFSVEADGNPVPTYQWSQSTDNGVTWTPIVGATSVSYTTPATSIAQTGTQFECALNNTYSTVTSNPATMTVTLLAAPSALKTAFLGARIGSRIIYGGVALTWKQSVSSGVTKNKIYRSIGAGSSSYSLLATISASTSYKDTNVVKGTTYNYVVTALNSSSGESPYSLVGTINY